MKSATIMAAALALAVIQSVRAQEDTNVVVTTRTTKITIADDYRRYRAPELSFDGFGTAAWNQQTLGRFSAQRVEHHTRLGVGAGLNFFFLRMLGIGADAYSQETRHNFIDSASGNLILRVPILDTGLAPYIYGGGGHLFDPQDRNFAQAGGGVEYRFVPNFGLFIDGRFVFAHNLDNYGMARAGFRIAF